MITPEMKKKLTDQGIQLVKLMKGTTTTPKLQGGYDQGKKMGLQFIRNAVKQGWFTLEEIGTSEMELQLFTPGITNCQ